eukprot:1954635-Pleurochrysis_carterae.AAC.1
MSSYTLNRLRDNFLGHGLTRNLQVESFSKDTSSTLPSNAAAEARVDTAADKKGMERIQQREKARLNVLQEREKKRVEKESARFRMRAWARLPLRARNLRAARSASAGALSSIGPFRERGVGVPRSQAEAYCCG